MPRIPVRVEPYSSPHLRQRHFKSKRDSILKALCTASYINGSQFAILWVNARGETEQYASELFQSRLGSWFDSEVVAQARQMVLAAGEAQANQNSNLSHLTEKEMEQDLQREELETEDGLEQVDPLSAGTLLTWDPNAELEKERKQSQTSSSSGQFHTLDFAATLKQRVQAPGLRRTFSMPTTIHGRAQSVGDLPSQKASQTSGSRPPALDLAAVREDPKFQTLKGPPTSSNPEYKALTIGNEDEVVEFLETRFQQLQQLVCKIVAKAWIKVIEPKKQTKFPYNKGDESKPDWWPEDARHKEPDHLMKPERISLLMTMLRCGRVLTNRLELATAEVAVFIPADKMILLREIYRVAREEERFRANEIPADTRVFVAATAVPTGDDLHSPVPSNVKVAEDHAPRSAPIQDTSMELQRSTSHQTPQFDDQDPFAETSDMHHGYGMMPPQNFYYTNPNPNYSEHATSAVMNSSQIHNANQGNASAISTQQFQQAQQHQMFLAQQAQHARRTSAPDGSRTQASYGQAAWPQQLGHSWQNQGVFQQHPMEGHPMHAAHMSMDNSVANTFYPSSAPLETPAKQTQQNRQEQQNLRSSPYLPTPLRPNLEGSYSASRNQNVSFSDYLHSPRTAIPGGMHVEAQEHEMHDEFH